MMHTYLTLFLSLFMLLLKEVTWNNWLRNQQDLTQILRSVWQEATGRKCFGALFLPDRGDPVIDEQNISRICPNNHIFWHRSKYNILYWLSEQQCLWWISECKAWKLNPKMTAMDFPVSSATLNKASPVSSSRVRVHVEGPRDTKTSWLRRGESNRQCHK